MIEKLALNLPGQYKIDPIMGMPSGGDNTLFNLITNGMTILFILLTLTALLFLIWGGISYITSQGDKNKVEAARKKIIYSIIGLIVGFSSYFIIFTVSRAFGVQVLSGDKPGRFCNRPSDCGRPSQWECVSNRCRER